MDLIDRRADKAIAVESWEIKELEQAEQSELLTFRAVPKDSFNLYLSPYTWGAFKGYPINFWDPSVDTVLTAGGSL
jgi:hypothetical protein